MIKWQKTQDRQTKKQPKRACVTMVEKDSFTEGKTNFKTFKERSSTKSVENIILHTLDPSKMSNFGLCSIHDFWVP